MSKRSHHFSSTGEVLCGEELQEERKNNILLQKAHLFLAPNLAILNLEYHSQRGKLLALVWADTNDDGSHKFECDFVLKSMLRNKFHLWGEHSLF
jgi:hypothetical protein